MAEPATDQAHTTATTLTAILALEAHPAWNIRACAPDPRSPALARGTTVPITAWTPAHREPQTVRATREQQAKDLCLTCPLLQACRAYALGDDGGPGEAWHIWGGMTAAERRNHVVRRALRTTSAETPANSATGTRATDDDGELPPLPLSPLDRTVLHALAAHHTPHAVATAAGLDLTRTNWHRSRLVTRLGLDPATTTRTQLLHAARTAGHLDPATTITPDPCPIAAVPSRQHTVTQHSHRSHGDVVSTARTVTQLAIPGLPTPAATTTTHRRRPRAPRRNQALAAAA